MLHVRRPWHLSPAAAAGLLAVLFATGCATVLAPHSGASVSSELILPGLHAPLQASSDSVRAKQLFVRGMTQAYLDNHQDAIGLYEEALKLMPNNPAVLAAIAESQEAVGDGQAALFYAQQARDLAPENVHYHRMLAQLFLGMGDARRAAGAYEELIDHFPDDIDALFELAHVHSVSGRFREAIQSYERLIETIGEDADVRREILQLYVRLGDDAGMERSLQELLDHQPPDDRLRRMLAELYVRQSRTEEAVALYEEALKETPDDVETILGLSDLYRLLGDDERAGELLQRSIDEGDASPDQLAAQAAPLFARSESDAQAAEAATRLLTRVLEIDPEHYDALMMLGSLRFHAQSYEEAGDLLYRALEHNPRDPGLWFQAAAAYLQAGDAPRSIDVADEGLLLFPGQLELLRLSAYALMDAYRNREAIRRFEETLEVISDDSPPDEGQRGELLSALGLLYNRQQDHARSDSAYHQALQADPENAVVLNNYAYSLAERDRQLERALEMATKAVEAAPENASFLDTLGWVYFKLDRYGEARDWISKAVATGQAGAAVYEHLGDVHAALNDLTTARRHWQQALDMNPERAGLRDKIARQP